MHCTELNGSDASVLGGPRGGWRVSLLGGCGGGSGRDVGAAAAAGA